MSGERNFLRVPPDSSGKRIRQVHNAQVKYTNKDTNIDWKIKRWYTLGDGWKIQVLKVFEETTVTGILDVKYEAIGEMTNLTPTVATSIQDPDTSAVVARVVEAYDVYVNAQNIVGFRDPSKGVDVDATGSLNIRFSEGLPQLDAFGKLRVSNGISLGDYVFINNILPNDFSTEKVGNATITHDDNLHAAILTCPAGVPAENTVDDHLAMDAVYHVTNTYHHYFPGFSQTFLCTVALGDEGRTGVTREWGYFDEESGYGFRSDDETGLKIFIRTSTSGIVTETVIPHAQFNGDKVDGTGDSGMNLRLVDDNIYWMDVQWLGAGRVRYGTYHRGQRVVIHEHYHEGDLNNGKPSSGRGSLPISFVIKNTGTHITDASMAVWCAAVHTEHNAHIDTIGRNRLSTTEITFDPTNITNGIDRELVCVLSPAHRVGGLNHTNRSLYLPNIMEAMAYHADGSDAFVEFEIYADAIVGGGDKALPITAAEITDASAPWFMPSEPLDLFNAVDEYCPPKYTGVKPAYFGGGIHVLSTHCKGSKDYDLSTHYSNFQDGAFKNYSVNGGTLTVPLAVVTPSPDGVTATTIQLAYPLHRHREGYKIKFDQITGTVGTDATNGLNYDDVRDNEYYIRIVGINTAELYHDIEFKQPVITQGLVFGGGGIITGGYGVRMYFVVTVRPLAPSIAKQATAGNITAHFMLAWSEVLQ